MSPRLGAEVVNRGAFLQEFPLLPSLRREMNVFCICSYCYRFALSRQWAVSWVDELLEPGDKLRQMTPKPTIATVAL